MALTRLPSFTLLSTDSYTFGNANVSGNISAGNVKTDHLLYSNGSPYVFTTNAAGSNTQIQFNDANSFAGSANLTFDKTSNTLTVTSIVANGAGLTSLTGGNVTGQVGNALVSGTVYTAAQPNITSVGTLTSLAVTGNIASGNANLGNLVTANFFSGNGHYLTDMLGTQISGEVAFANKANSVAVANVSGIGNIATINKDGNASNILYGNGVFASAPVTYGNSNVATFLSSFGSNSITTTGNVTVGNIIGNGQALTGLPGANVTGAVAYATTANSVAVANVSGIGNIATINKDGNASNVLYGNGVFASSYGNSNVSTYLASFGSNSITTTGNISVGNITVSGKTSLNSVSNITITGGFSNQFLRTDGSGNLSWVTPTGTTITVDNFTGNGVQTAYTLSVTPASAAYTMVALAGTLQPRSIYSLTGNVLTFSSAPPATAPIEITTFSSVMGFGTADITANSFTANSLTANVLSGNITSASTNLSVNTIAANSIVNNGTGIPTVNSTTSINLTAATVVRTTSSPFQFYNCSSTVRDTIAASNGYVIYNTTTNKLQVYANGVWADLN